MDADAALVLRCYPQIFFACHTRHVRNEATGRSVSAHQASVLDHLDEVQPTPLAELAMHMGVTASTMSLTVERLVRGGYIGRNRSGEDARRLELRLTAAGVAMRRDKQVLDPALVCAALGRLDERRRKQALRGLELLAGACAAMVQSKSLPDGARRGAA